MVKELRTTSEVLESFEEPHSVEFTISSKGTWGAKVKCYGKTPQEALKNTSEISKSVEVILAEKNAKARTTFKETWNEVNKK